MYTITAEQKSIKLCFLLRNVVTDDDDRVDKYKYII